MILVDTSVWADHFRRSDAELSRQLQRRQACIHPFVLGELAMGNLRDWHRAVQSLSALPRLEAVRERDFLEQVRQHGWAGSGIGFVDAHLLAAVAISPGAKLWTRDKRLAALAERLDLRWEAV